MRFDHVKPIHLQGLWALVLDQVPGRQELEVSNGHRVNFRTGLSNEWMNEWLNVHTNARYYLSRGHCPDLWFFSPTSSPVSLAAVSVRAPNQAGYYSPRKVSPQTSAEGKQFWSWDSSFQLDQAKQFYCWFPFDTSDLTFLPAERFLVTKQN